MLSQSEEQTGHWLLVEMCLFARIPKHGIAPNNAFQQWILTFAGRGNFHSDFQTGLAFEVSVVFVRLNFQPCWNSHCTWYADLTVKLPLLSGCHEIKSSIIP